MQEARISKPPVVTEILDPNKLEHGTIVDYADWNKWEALINFKLFVDVTI